MALDPDRHPQLGETLDMLGALDRMIRELTFARNHAVTLALQRGASLREVAAIVGVAHSTVRNLHARHVAWGANASYCRPEPPD